MRSLILIKSMNQTPPAEIERKGERLTCRSGESTTLLEKKKENIRERPRERGEEKIAR